ncbi:MAG: DUF4337 domain-containing protein [Rhodospirillaceae bacterium]
MVEPTDVTDTLDELEESATDGRTRQWVAIFISSLAVILAITSMGGGNATKDMMNANIVVNDTYAFYQAKNIRQNEVRLAADQLKALKGSTNWLPSETSRWIDERVKAYAATAEKYESDPKSGEGKVELLARARQYEAIRDHAAAQDPFFDYAEALIQIAIVLASASLVGGRRWVLYLAYIFAGIGVLLTINAFTLLVALPGS